MRVWECDKCGSDKKSTHVSICQKCYAREWARKNMVKIRVSTSNYREKNLEKRRAWAKAKRGIKLEGLCVVCKDNLAEVRHHEDYTKPIEVMLICKKCHKAIHSSHQNNNDQNSVQGAVEGTSSVGINSKTGDSRLPSRIVEAKGLCKCGHKKHVHHRSHYYCTYCALIEGRSCYQFELDKPLEPVGKPIHRGEFADILGAHKAYLKIVGGSA